MGVLYLTYDDPRDFSYGAKQRLDAFARNVAPVLQSARALDSGRELLGAAEEVSRVLALGHEMQVLNSVAARTRSSVRCYSVTIFTLDEHGLPKFPPASVEGADITAIVAHDREDADEIIPKLMQKREMTIARNASEVQKIFGTKFVAREQIQTTFAAPLFFHNRPAGILFASFRNELPEREIEPVKNLISLFGNQAAVAIGNAARFRGLESLTSKLLGADPQKGVFRIASEFLMDELQPTHCTFVMRENQQLRVVAQVGWSSALFKEVIEEDSHAGFTIRTEEPNHFEDVYAAMRDPAFAGFHAPQRMLDAGIVSGLAVPLRFGNTIHGAVLLHSTSRRNFDDEDALFVGLVANETMSAHRSMTMLRRSLAQYRVAEAIAKASQTRSAEGGPGWKDALDPKCVLDETLRVCLESLTDGAGQPKASAGSIELREPKLVTASIEPDTGVAVSESIAEDLTDGRRVMGRIELWNFANRIFDADDRLLVKNIATLLTLFARQMEEQDRVLKNLATTTHEYQRCDDAIKKAMLLLEDAGLNEDQREELTYIKDALLRLEDHHDKMTYTVKVLTGQLAPNLAPRDVMEVHELLRKCRDRFTDNAAIDKVQLALLDPGPDMRAKRVNVDGELLAVVFNNLFGNALKFSAAGQSVTCSAHVRGKQLRIEFVDQGPGIPEPARQRIFDPWVQAEEHAKYQTKSFGVGLFVSKRITQMQGGDLTVETPVSNARGSRFTVALPLCDAGLYV